MRRKLTKPNKWVGISGSWAVTTSEVETDVRKTVRNVIKRSGGIVTGGHLMSILLPQTKLLK